MAISLQSWQCWVRSFVINLYYTTNRTTYKENLQNISDDDLPIMRALLGHFKVNEPNGLGPPKIQLPKNYPVANTIFGSLRIPKRVVDSVKDDILSTYRLNEDQQAYAQI